MAVAAEIKEELIQSQSEDTSSNKMKTIQAKKCTARFGDVT